MANSYSRLYSEHGNSCAMLQEIATSSERPSPEASISFTSSFQLAKEPIPFMYC